MQIRHFRRFRQNGFCQGAKTRFTVRAEIISELIPERADPVIFRTFLLELIACRPIPVKGLQEEQSLKITGNDN